MGEFRFKADKTINELAKRGSKHGESMGQLLATHWFWYRSCELYH